MGKKKGAAEEAKVEVPAPTNAAEDEDAPIVKALKEIDLKYCAIEMEFEQEMEALRKKYREERQVPLLAERSKVLGDIASCPKQDVEFGTPACKGFWLQAFQNADAFAEILEEWDEPVLQYLDDVKRSDFEGQLPQKGFKLDFLFKENPFFTNGTLSLEVHTDYDPASYKPWKELECAELKATQIDWKAGKNITVEVVQKKAKGGGAKKAKQKAKAKEEPRNSLFRHLFRSLKVGDPAPPELLAMVVEDHASLDPEDKEEASAQVCKMALENCHELGHCIAEEVIPYAVRFYTGEAGDADDSDSEGSESEEDDDDDDDDDDSEEATPPAKGKKGGKAQPKKAAGGGEAGAKQEECKQQ